MKPHSIFILTFVAALSAQADFLDNDGRDVLKDLAELQNPQASPTQAPTPEPQPTPAPQPTPEPQPTPAPQPAPQPTPTPQPAPRLAPATATPTPPKDISSDDGETLKADISQAYEHGDNPQFRELVDQLTPLQDKEDIATFRQTLTQLQAAFRPKTILHLTQEAQKKSIHDLSSKEASQGGTWYTGPRVVARLDPDWVAYYSDTVIPKLDAFLRPLATHVYETDIAFEIKKDSQDCLIIHTGSNLQYSRFMSSIKKSSNYSYFFCYKPLAPKEFANPKEGRVVRMHLSVFCLPAAYNINTPNKSLDYTVHAHIFDAQNKYISSFPENSMSQASLMTGSTNSHYKPGWGLSWLMQSPNGIMHIEWRVAAYRGDSRRPISIHVPEGKTFGGVIVTFRPYYDCFE